MYHMRITFLILGVILLAIGCRDVRFNGIPKEYNDLLIAALDKSGQNRMELETALTSCPAGQKEGMAFLIAYMPERDLEVLSSGFLLENVAIAYRARETFAWARELPDSLFFNDVLPYASLNENRDNWRHDFYTRFSKYVTGAPDVLAAIDSVNQHIRDEVLVDYNTRREKPDQSPYESMRQGMASCSGLSILLTDAFRAVGIPARIVGTPNWHDKRGNHNWNEVYANGQWYFTEYYPSGLNKSWFLADAGLANPDDPETSIYASSWKTTGLYFPLVWDLDIHYVPGINVTTRYIQLYEAEKALEAAQGNKVILEVAMYRNNSCSLQGDQRIEANVDIFCGEEQVGGGRTSGPLNDLNDLLTFYVDKNKTFTLRYVNEKGITKAVDVPVGSEKASVRLFWED